MWYCPYCVREPSETHADMKVVYCDLHLVQAEAEYQAYVAQEKKRRGCDVGCDSSDLSPL